MLGLNFLAKSSACVDIGRPVLKLHSVEVPLLPTYTTEQEKGPAAGRAPTKEGPGVSCWLSKEEERSMSATAAKGDRAAVTSAEDEGAGREEAGRHTLPEHLRDLAASSAIELTPA